MGTIKVVYDGAIHARLKGLGDAMDTLKEQAAVIQHNQQLDDNAIAQLRRQVRENHKAIMRVDARVSQLEATVGEHEAALEALRVRSSRGWWLTERSWGCGCPQIGIHDEASDFCLRCGRRRPERPGACPFCGQVMP